MRNSSLDPLGGIDPKTITTGHLLAASGQNESVVVSTVHTHTGLSGQCFYQHGPTVGVCCTHTHLAVTCTTPAIHLNNRRKMKSVICTDIHSSVCVDIFIGYKTIISNKHNVCKLTDEVFSHKIC